MRNLLLGLLAIAIAALPANAQVQGGSIYRPSAVIITGGSINGTTIGASSASTIRGTTITATTSMASPSIAMGTAGATKGTITLSGNTSGTVTVQPAAAAGTWSLTLPNTGGTTGYALTTSDGAGTLAWTQVTTPTSTETMTNKTLTSPKITVQTLAATATPTWDMSAGNMGTLALGANITAITTTNLPTTGSIAIRITQDSTPRTITWPNGDGTSTLKVKWSGGTAPTLSTGSGAVDMVTCNVFTQFIWYCVWVGNFS